ncbi:LuxR C-terminal-related transcriptional regulator [Microbulbifer sp. OS29]|uniref:LuxR C-terminal-related transcriptional regulator n=1 Tax=Microbulbifer okhotskensis TaxID=2926617 RepID=A0A9X2EPT1_9GAMM|nr:LuxR C-terminal-related transcriptional regulator [Microbulbifer okhotskensis]MCO1336214.1 LuxR C-terminal-related transcriptional regulator [Microbulbifer okhotskensis]
MHTTQYRPLAPRQAEALTHRAQGLSNRETAQAMRCSVTNVTNLLAECFYKLHARNSTDAVAKAVKHGLIQFILILTVIGGISADQEQLRTRFQRRLNSQTLRIRNRENLA